MSYLSVSDCARFNQPYTEEGICRSSRAYDGCLIEAPGLTPGAIILASFGGERGFSTIQRGGAHAHVSG